MGNNRLHNSSLNEEIQRLRADGKTFRQIGSALGITHVAILKRWRAIQVGKKVVTDGIAERLPQLSKEERNPPTRSNPHTQRLSEGSDQGGNQVVTKKAPGSDMGGSVNPPLNPHRGACRGKREGNSPRPNDLVGDLIRFLENKGFEVYPMQNGGYQVKSDRETIRFYISRRDE